MAENDYKINSGVVYPPPSLASDDEFNAGTSTTASPSVKQAKENLVTIDTPQTVSGRKKFTEGLIRHSNTIDINNIPTVYTPNNGFRFEDKNTKTLGFLENAVSGGYVFTSIHALNKDSYQPNVGVKCPKEGTTGAYGYAPETPPDAPFNSIATKQMHSNSTNWMPIRLVADDGNQQVTPTDNDVRCGIGLLQNATYTKGDGFSSWIISERKTTGTTTAALCVRRFLESDTNAISTAIGVGITPDGSLYSLAPTMPTGNNDNVIATTKWVNSKMQVVSALPATPDSNVFYFIPE